MRSAEKKKKSVICWTCWQFPTRTSFSKQAILKTLLQHFFFPASIHVSQPGSSLKLFGDSRKQNTKWIMRLWKRLMKGDSQERKPNHILAYFICYASTESSELVWPFASTPLLYQQEAAVAGTKGQLPLERMYLNASEPWLALPFLISPYLLIAWCSHTYKQGNGNNDQKKNHKWRLFLMLAHFFLNQSAGNKAGFCSLLKGAEQQRLQESSHLLLVFWGSVSVPMSPSFWYWKAVDQAAKALFSMSACSESPQFLLCKYIINDTLFCLHALTRDCIL